MQIHIQAHQLHDAQSFREAALARARFMFRRASQEVLQARILLRDLNGPRGGVDQQCRVTLVTRSRGTLVVTSRAQTAREALAHALRTAVRALVRVWQRKRRPDRKGLLAQTPSSRTDSVAESTQDEIDDASVETAMPRIQIPHGAKTSA